VIPTDAPDEQLDVNGLLTSSIARMQAWLAGQTGGPKLRIDTYQGQPDITFVRTSESPPDPFSEGLVVRGFVERLGFTNPKKVYIAYLGTFAAPSCGLADRGAKAGVVWLTCALGWPTTAPFSLIDSVAMHETLHALGAVPDGAPNGYPTGHVRDPRDIMDYRAKQPDESGQVTVQLDPGRDDYWGHSMRDETDVADSRYLDSNPISGTPKLRLGTIVPVRKVAGGRLHVRARVSNPGTGRVTVRCSAKQGKRRLRVAAARYAGGTALCTFAGVRRGLVSGKITVRSGQAVASRTFRVRPTTSGGGK
jgi:hypothetical protein